MPTALPCFHLRMPAALDNISRASLFLLKLLSLPIFFVVPLAMPPLPGYKRLCHAEHLISIFRHGQLIEIFLLVLIAATVVWLVVTYTLQRKSWTVGPDANIPEKVLIKPSLERQDSATCQKHWEADHNDRLNSLKQEILEHTEKPIHPWILPPQALPGPYDPMYYPLPAPTIRPMSTGSSLAKPEGRHPTSYTHLVPSTGARSNEAILYETITTSTNGWRRTHWNVTGG